MQRIPISTEISFFLISCNLTQTGIFHELRPEIMHSRKIWIPLQLELPITVMVLLTMLRCRKISLTLNASTLWNWFQYGHEWCHWCSPASQLEWKKRQRCDVVTLRRGYWWCAETKEKIVRKKPVALLTGAHLCPHKSLDDAIPCMFCGTYLTYIRQTYFKDTSNCLWTFKHNPRRPHDALNQ